MMSQPDSNEEPPTRNTSVTDELLIDTSVEAERSEPRRTAESDVIGVDDLSVYYGDEQALRSVADEELCVCELEQLVDVSEIAVSHALSDLVGAGLANPRGR